MTSAKVATTTADGRPDTRGHIAHVEYEGLSLPIIGPASGITTPEQVEAALNLILGRNGHSKR